MDTDGTSRFQHARRFERDLNERQRAILARIAKGQTNAEIAAAFDMTFDGAKWNVSEILTKLGLSSREEAAEYWRWRQGIASRAKSALRALVPAGLPMKLVAGGGLAAIGVVALVLLAILGDEPGSAVADFVPYRMTFISGSRNDPTGAGLFVTEERLDDRHFRHIVFTPAYRGDEEQTVVTVADGEYVWLDSSSMPEYYRMSVDAALKSRAEIENLSLFPGPARVSSVEALLDVLRKPRGAQPANGPQYAEIVGQDTLLGVPVVVIEFYETIGGAGAETAGFVLTVRVWVDTATMFILKYESTTLNSSSDDTGIVMEVTAIEYDPEFEPETFTFVPPPGKSLSLATPVMPEHDSSSGP